MVEFNKTLMYEVGKTQGLENKEKGINTFLSPCVNIMRNPQAGRVWEAFGEDITYNFYKTAAVYNDRVTMTYKNKTKELDTYEYYGERVLPYYTQKSDFKKYKVLKARVADYTHFVANFEYGAVEIA